jgi:AcrR family transcriptional regulator
MIHLVTYWSVARPSPSDRLADVAAAGTEVLGRLGYRRTKMADVASAAGLSAGAVYTYVESKEALLHLVFAWFFGEYGEGSLPELPVMAPPFSETLELVATGLRREARTPILRAAVDRAPAVGDSSELREIVGELYSMVDRLWPVLAVIETCAVDLPELYRFYFEGRRPSQVRLLARYLEARRTSDGPGHGGDPELTAQLAMEVVTWHAWHRREGFDATRFTDPASRDAVIAFVCNALERS